MEAKCFVGFRFHSFYLIPLSFQRVENSVLKAAFIRAESRKRIEN
jgi:hypothetical protein